jgi:hypothetical protein
LAGRVQKTQLPAIFNFRDQSEVGGLMSYSWDLKATARRNAQQIAEILKGANPAYSSWWLT